MFLIKGLHRAMGISKGTTTDFMVSKNNVLHNEERERENSVY